MIHDQEHLKFTAQPNNNMYWERVDCSLGWLGNTKTEQHQRFVGYTKRPHSIYVHLKNGNLSFLAKEVKN
ncbi:Uncharacterised protein [Scardovia inopinata]|uniref:Uncharacterized protein n=1 Tax=Scardovia inopinata F0304 TaxID=641146 RepID=W1MXF7_SCAIO|nr:hypothetical protein [Scardovia inopinata]EQW14656.1 hypothetical protein HMPREF9020_01545 [Scardovia inopinata F0304]SUV51383.1 Uncharacterised protein [Scardovia inopinata]